MAIDRLNRHCDDSACFYRVVLGTVENPDAIKTIKKTSELEMKLELAFGYCTIFCIGCLFLKKTVMADYI